MKGNMKMKETEYSAYYAHTTTAPGLVQFIAEGDGRLISYEQGSVAVWRGQTDTGEKCFAMQLSHITNMSPELRLLSREGAAALVILLGDALSKPIKLNSKSKKTKK